MKPDWLNILLDSLAGIFSWLSLLFLALGKWLVGSVLQELKDIKEDLKIATHDIATIKGQKEGVSSVVLDQIAHLHERVIESDKRTAKIIEESDKATARRFNTLEESIALLIKIHTKA